jgi:hypothetical protein
LLSLECANVGFLDEILSVLVVCWAKITSNGRSSASSDF